MDKNGGWIKLHRRFLEWEWFDDLPTRNVFLVLLMGAEYENKKWHGLEIQAGQMLTTIAELARLSGFSEKQVRTALQHLEKTGEIIKSVPMKSAGTLITICNWNRYQFGDETRAEEENSEKQPDERVGGNFLSQSGDRQAEERAESGHEENPPIEPIREEQPAWTGHKGGEYIYKEIEEYNNIYIYDRENLFHIFWRKYPKKFKAEYDRCKAMFEGCPYSTQCGILTALDEFSASQNWKKDGGKWIPSPTRWLAEERWKWVGTWRTAPPHRQEKNSYRPQPTYELDEIQRLMIINSMS